jgi:hypothetical protein
MDWRGAEGDELSVRTAVGGAHDDADADDADAERRLVDGEVVRTGAGSGGGATAGSRLSTDEARAHCAFSDLS